MELVWDILIINMELGERRLGNESLIHENANLKKSRSRPDFGFQIYAQASGSSLKFQRGKGRGK